MEKQTEKEQDPRVTIQRLEHELNTSLRIERKLTQKLGQKELEIALMAVQMDDLKAGFDAMRQKYEGVNENEQKGD